jgi:putative transposase
VSDKYAFIDAEYAQAGEAPTIERMCRWLQVSKSGYYEWLHRPPSATTQRRELLKIKIAALFGACDGTYGYRRLHAELVAGGEHVGLELVRQLMRALGLVAASRGVAHHHRPGRGADNHTGPGGPGLRR